MRALLVAAALVGATPAFGQDLTSPPLTAAEIAAYRLTNADFARFEQASRRIGTVTRAEPRFSTAPLFTREVALLDDVGAAAAGLEARLRSEGALAEALAQTSLASRDFTKFALALIAARLAEGFLSAGVLRGVPPGVATDNVAFVRAQRSAVEAVLAELGVEGVPADPPR